jgi:hypothetical protein
MNQNKNKNRDTFFTQNTNSDKYEQLDTAEPSIQSVASDMYINDEYFKNAREWFFQKYLMQYKMRSVFILISGFICIITTFALYLLFSEIMKPSSINGVVVNPVSPQTALHIKKITDNRNKHSDKAIAKFLIEDFIVKLEQFDSSGDRQKELDKKNNIFADGSLQKNMFNVFQNRFSSVYIPSYISYYSRKIQIVKFTFVDEVLSLTSKIRKFLTPSQIGDEAIVVFSVKYQDQDEQVVSSERYVARVHFYFRPIKIMQDGKASSIKFFIESYSIKKIN